MKWFSIFSISVLAFLGQGCTPNESQNGTTTGWFKKSNEARSQVEKRKSEHYDPSTGLYANYYAGFSMKFPYRWTFDKGNSEHTIARWIQEDSAFSFSIGMNELSVKDKKESIWKAFDKEKNDKTILKGLEDQLQSKVFQYKAEKIWFANHPAIQRSFVYEVRHYDEVYDMKAMMIQIGKENKIYTLGLHLPLYYCNSNPDRFERIMDRFYFGVQNQ